MEAQGSWLTNKYAEGLPGKRYYGGCEFVDIAEDLAQDRALGLFPGAEHVNVQPHSGAQANMAAYFAVLEPGDRMLGMNLAHGGHLTHGMASTSRAGCSRSMPYGVDRETRAVRLRRARAAGPEVQPKLIVAGASAYPRIIDFERMAPSPMRVDALLFVDMAHIAGLVAAGLHPTPVPARGHRDDDHAQDPPRAAWRPGLQPARPARGIDRSAVPAGQDDARRRHRQDACSRSSRAVR